MVIIPVYSLSHIHHTLCWLLFVRVVLGVVERRCLRIAQGNPANTAIRLPAKHRDFYNSRKSSFTVVRTTCVLLRSMKGMLRRLFVNLLSSSLLLNFARTTASVRPVTS